ncbi:MAG: PhnD/SsuA/transferrin family substrate-binding protein [Campylobacterota bacterium]|nr:PhnD/SsuA/transferrin family substrate-binding protein [Campylobacterota bacterium]
MLFLTACTNENNDKYEIVYTNKPPFEKKIYIFGVHPLHNPKKLFEVYQPLVDYINKQLVDATIKLEASRNYAAYDKKLFSGYFDLSLPNPYQTIVAAQKGYDIFGKMADDENFRGIFIVRKDSNIKKVDQIKGKTVSYPAPTALAATMMPQHFLHINGIDINKDIKNSYVGSQESSIMNVYLKKTIAGSTWPPPWIAFKKEHPKIASQLEIKWETKHLLNNGLVAKKDFPKELLSKVSNIIFNLHTHKEGKKILKAMELSRYEKADYKTYDKVREFVKNFEQNIRTIRIEK